MNESERDELIAAACDVRKRAYAKYSGFHVGAALRADDGRVFTGSNVENAVYGLTICAERVAMATAVSNGVRRFEAIAVATSSGAAPCGSCRQFLAEFCEELRVLLVDVDRDNRVEEVKLSELLPIRFTL